MSDNELIAEFHGWTSRKIGKGTGKTYWDFPAWGRSSFVTDSLKYHESWDWIMPVWIKFRDLYLDDARHCDWVTSLQWYLFSSDEPKRFAERMAYAIKWYNSTKETTLTRQQIGEREDQSERREELDPSGFQ